MNKIALIKPITSDEMITELWIQAINIGIEDTNISLIDNDGQEFIFEVPDTMTNKEKAILFDIAMSFDMFEIIGGG